MTIKIEVNSEECHNAVKVDLPIMKKEMQFNTIISMAMSMTTSWYRRGKTSIKLLIHCSHERRVHGHKRGLRRCRI